MKTFKAVFTPDEDGAWNVTIPAVDGCITWGRSLTEARRNIREALAVSLDDPKRATIAAKATITEVRNLPAGVGSWLKKARDLRHRAEQLQAKLHAAQVMAAAELTREGKLSLRDAGEFLNLSPEGVRKVLEDAPPMKTRRLSGART
ncbi:MAG: type II toxin-antitoxin system HicB family antitoxin [Polyangiaceae bacterium]